jgi:hypothetical protein
MGFKNYLSGSGSSLILYLGDNILFEQTFKNIDDPLCPADISPKYDGGAVEFGGETKKENYV